jgi:N-acetylglucosaminyl-diphospho-decaprenol L-rhamnosyltransferase
MRTLRFCSGEGRVPAEVDVSVLVVNYNTAHLLPRMFDTLAEASKGLSVEVIMLDNASRDGSPEVLREQYPHIQTIFNKVNVGFGRANNQCLELARGKHVLLLNTDAFVAPDTLRLTLHHLSQHPECGAVGVRLIGRDLSLQPSCRYFPTPLNVFLTRVGLHGLMPWVRPVDDMNWDHRGMRACDWIPGCYILMRRDDVARIGLFDPRFFLYCEEVDLCKRIKAAGFEVHYLGDTEVIHLGGESAKSDAPLSAAAQISSLQIESELLYFRKHHGALGLLAHISLSLIGDGILALKAILKGRWSATRPTLIGHLQDLLRLCRSTRWGTAPTR